MMDSMMWGMGLGHLLVLIILALVVAALASVSDPW